MTKTTKHIVIAVDQNKNYLKQCFVMLYSLCFHNQEWSINIHVFHTKEAKELFQVQREYISHFVWTTHVVLEYYEVDWATVEKMWLPIYNNLPLTTYFRLLAPSLLSEDIERCLYLDTDTLIRWPIDALYEVNFTSDDYLAWVMTNMLSSYMLNIDAFKYFNAWVLVFNLKKRRELKLADLVISFISQYPSGLHGTQPIMGDQCWINYVCSNHIVAVEPKWNCTPIWFKPSEISTFPKDVLWYSDTQLKESISNPIILHFAWTQKPCDRFSIHPKKLIYYRYVLHAGLFSFTDLCKFVFHCFTYMINTDTRLYAILRGLKQASK